MNRFFKAGVGLIAVVWLISLIIGCAGQQVGSGSFIDSTYKILYTSGQSYRMAMETIDVLRDSGEIDPADFMTIDKYDNLYRLAYHSAVRALTIYRAAADEADKAKVMKAVSECTKALSQFLDFVEPYLSKM